MPSGIMYFSGWIDNKLQKKRSSIKQHEYWNQLRVPNPSKILFPRTLNLNETFIEYVSNH